MVAAVLVACGVAASATAFSLTGTARNSFPTGWEIPALHDAASDQPIPYTPDCTGGAFTVCIHPAFDPYLGAMSAALQPAAAEIAGLPGAPVRAEMTSGDALPAVAGTTSVYAYSTGAGRSRRRVVLGHPGHGAHGGLGARGAAGLHHLVRLRPGRAGLVRPDPGRRRRWRSRCWPRSAPRYRSTRSSAGRARSRRVEHVGRSAGRGTQPGATAAQITAAASRFESLSSAARHAWLAANIAALRSGAITLAQIP